MSNFNFYTSREFALLSPVGSALLTALLAANVAAQTAKAPKLILQTVPESTEIALDPDAVVRIIPETGDLDIVPLDTSLQCSANGSGGGCDDVQLEILDFQPETAIEAFTSQTLELSWDTRGAWECRGAGDGLEDTGWTTSEFTLLPRRSELNPFELELSSADLEGADSRIFDLTLECRNGATEAVPLTRELTVRAITAGSCDGRGAPPDLARDLQLLRDDDTETRTWASVFDRDFPDGNTNTRTARIERSQYAQLEFNTVEAAPGDVGSIVTNLDVTSSDAALGPVLWSLSQCPGDFGPAVPENCRGIVNPGGIPGSFRFQVEGTSGSRCVLENDAQYFVNLVPALEVPSSQSVEWNCAGSTSVNACEFLFRYLPE